MTGVINLKVIFRLSSILEEVVESVCLISPHKTVNRDFLSKGGMDFVIWIRTELKFSSFLRISSAGWPLLDPRNAPFWGRVIVGAHANLVYQLRDANAYVVY